MAFSIFFSMFLRFQKFTKHIRCFLITVVVTSIRVNKYLGTPTAHNKCGNIYESRLERVLGHRHNCKMKLKTGSGQEQTGQIWSGTDRTDLVRNRQDRSGHEQTGQIWSGTDRQDLVRNRQDRSGQEQTG